MIRTVVSPVGKRFLFGSWRTASGSLVLTAEAAGNRRMISFKSGSHGSMLSFYGCSNNCALTIEGSAPKIVLCSARVRAMAYGCFKIRW
jgi:hypothetical protein